MPRVAIKAQAFIENLLTDFCFAIGSRIRAPSFIRAPRVKAQPDEVLGCLRFENHRINTRLELAWIPRIQCFLYRLPGDPRRIEFADIKVVAEEISGTAAIWSAR